MKKIIFFLILIVSISVACSNSTSEDIIIETTVTANLSGSIEYTLDTLAISKNVNPRVWTIGKKSKLDVKVSKNLTSNPYNIKLTLKVDESNPKAPVLSFISDFDRKITPGDRYRLITTAILSGSTSFIPGNTGGQIFYDNSIGSYGFGFGSELEITIAKQGATIIDNSAQFLILSGTFVYDNNNKSSLEVGRFNVVIDGNNIVNTSIF